MRIRQTVESPLRISSFVAETGISQRQIERLFQRHLNCSPRQYYLDLQLALAWQLCEQTEMSLLEVALASGFGSNFSLARRFRQRFAVSPTELRASRLP
nr:helix-turn-helix domain-containing protein [Tabrizicola sp. SY72]